MTQLFDAGPYLTAQSNRRIAVDPDGQRFLLLKDETGQTGTEDPTQPKIIVVINWFQELTERVPTGQSPGDVAHGYSPVSDKCGHQPSVVAKRERAAWAPLAKLAEQVPEGHEPPGKSQRADHRRDEPWVELRVSRQSLCPEGHGDHEDWPARPLDRNDDRHRDYSHLSQCPRVWEDTEMEQVECQSA